MSKVSVQLQNGADELDAQERHPAGKDAVPRGEIRRSLPGAIHDQELVLEEKRLRNYGTDAARSEQPGQSGDEVDEKNDQITHRRIVAGRRTLRNHGRNNNSPATGCGLEKAELRPNGRPPSPLTQLL